MTATEKQQSIYNIILYYDTRKVQQEASQPEHRAITITAKEARELYRKEAGK